MKKPTTILDQKQMVGRGLRQVNGHSSHPLTGPHEPPTWPNEPPAAPVGSYRERHDGLPRFYVRKVFNRGFMAFIADYRGHTGRLFGPAAMGKDRLSIEGATVAEVMDKLQLKFG